VLEVYRIVTAQRVAEAFTGDGARLYGGRWNPKGLRVVYTAGSRALAMLEMLVQDQPLRADYAIVPVRIPATVRVGRIAPKRLPHDWWAPDRLDELRALGRNWIVLGRTAALRVPSAVIPSEFNYLINPEHPEFAQIRIGSREIF
jgi:RES domain-containing protein